MSMRRGLGVGLGLLLSLWLLPVSASSPRTDCPAWLDTDLRLLRSEETLNLCEQYAGQPLLIVNTASYCGFTKQFGGLEELYQEYKDSGLMVLGFPSDDFLQEADEEQTTAEVCYANYGVTFPMFAPIRVRGSDAHPLYQQLAGQGGGSPRWNFYKFLLNGEGRVVGRFSSRVTPGSDTLREAIEAVLPE